MESGLRRQLGTEANRGCLRQLPIFRPDFRLPREFGDLLEEIERSERKRDERKD